MKEFDIFELKKTLDCRNIALCFNGPFTRNILDELGNAIKSHIKSAQIEQSLMYDVFSVFMEMVLNVRNYIIKKRYVEQGLHDYSSAALVVSVSDNVYSICSGNAVDKLDIDYLTKTLSSFNSMDRKDLKEMYKERKLKKLPKDATSAGLGLMNIVKKASEPLQYRVRDINQTHCFFSLKVVISGSIKSLYIQATSSTPRVQFHSQTGSLSIIGESYPENAFEFYSKLSEWLYDYLVKTSNPITLNLRLVYLNTSSAKCLMDLFDMLERAYKKGRDIAIYWRYDNENDWSTDTAEEFKEEMSLPFHIVPIAE
jgi:hypothetical protein